MQEKIIYKNEFLKEIREEALKRAHETRKFEIDLFWKRTTYFWAFVAASFGAYFVFFDKASDLKYLLVKIVIIFIGITFSYAWYAVSKGSKFWQENWELHVDNLEDEYTGPLYKIIKNPNTKRGFLEAKALSVSKINMLLSINIILIWNVIGGFEIYNILNGTIKCKIIATLLVLIIVNVLIRFEFFFLPVSNLPNNNIDEKFSRRNKDEV